MNDMCPQWLGGAQQPPAGGGSRGMVAASGDRPKVAVVMLVARVG